MNESSKRLLQERSFRRYFWLAFISIVAGFLVTLWRLSFPDNHEVADFEAANALQRIFICSAVCFAVLLFLRFVSKWLRVLGWLRHLLRWLFCWLTIKRGILALGILLGLVAIAYVEENWRGERAWENYKREWEVMGERFKFASFVPPPVPDEQNFALTPIVLSCYSHLLDRSGHPIKPEDTNVVNRLKMDIHRKRLPANTNMAAGSWQKARLTDLKAWQNHYRTMFLTNEVPDGVDGDRLQVEPVTNEFPIAPQPQTPGADVLLALSKFDLVIEVLRQASKRPYSRFPLYYDAPDPPEMLLPHLKSLRSCSAVLGLRATAELENGESGHAVDDVKLDLYLAHAIRHEPFVLSQNIRLSILQSAIQPIWEGLAKRKWTDAQLATMEQDLAKFDALESYELLLRGERAQNLKTVQYLRGGRMTNSVTCMGGDPLFWPTLGFRLLPGGWFCLNELAIARIYQQSLLTETERGQRMLSSAAASRSENALVSRLNPQTRFQPCSFLAWMLVPAFEPVARQFAFTQAAADMAKTGCALERCRLANGGFPETLEALAPKFIEKVPHDVITGQPLHYRRTEDGQFVLYSVGWDKKDDGGQIELNPGGTVNLRKGDWVWRYPAN